MMSMDVTQQTDVTRNSATCVFSRTTGIRESRKFFSYVSRANTPAAEEGSGGDGDEALLDLQELLKKTWNIWGVSLMFDFNTEEVQLKQYAKKLREEVAAILLKEEVSYNAKITVLDLQRPKETDHPIVKVEVSAKKVAASKNDKETVMYEGYFLSWHSEAQESMMENTTRLPLLLCRGTVNTVRAVHATLSKMFDCLFVALPANAEDLMWLLPIVMSPGAGQDTAKDHDETLIEYAIPGLPKSSSITIKFQSQDLIKLWRSLLQSHDRVQIEEVETFYEAVLKQALVSTNLQLKLCLLQRITFPSLTISENKMKVTSVRSMNTILTYLNEKALESLHLNTSHFSV